MMNKWTLKFKSSLLELMYQRNRNQKIYSMFKQSFRMLVSLSLINCVISFLDDHPLRYVSLGIPILLIFIYIYVLMVNNNSAKYFLCFVAFLLNAYQWFIGDGNQQAFLVGNVINYIQLGMVSQTGLELNTVLMILLMVTRIGISSVDGFHVMQVLLPFTMLFYNYYIYVNEYAFRTLFLQSLQEDQWGNNNYFYLLQDNIIPSLTDKKIIMLTFNDDKIAFVVKQQNIFYEANEQDNSFQIMQLLRELRTSRTQTLEQYLFCKYKLIKNDPQPLLLQEGIKLVKPRIKSVVLNWNRISLLTINLQKLNFILVLEEKVEIDNKKNQMKTFISILNKTNLVLRDQFQLVDEIYWQFGQIQSQQCKFLKEKVFGLRLKTLLSLIKCANIAAIASPNQQRTINLTTINLEVLLNKINGYFNDLKTVQFQIGQVRSRLLIQTDNHHLQLLLLSLYSYCLSLFKRGTKPQSYSKGQVQIQIVVDDRLNLLKICFIALPVPPRVIKFSRLTQSLYKKLSPYKQIGQDTQNNTGIFFQFQFYLVWFRLTLYKQLGSFYKSLALE